jgi:hydrogenase nickel incorporation protein HypB
MCTTCGCAETAAPRLTDPATGRHLDLTADDAPHVQGTEGHAHEHGHAGHRHEAGRTVAVQEAVLSKNARLADRNRAWLQARQITAVNLISAPGSGKTTILERTIRELQAGIPIQVIEGDQETVHDAERILRAGCRVVQINTGPGCHLEADMVARGLEELAPVPGSVVLIENVGNLVCPALFDLGEHARVVILSVTEGEDKPLKYPHIFRTAEVLLLNKIDLLPYLRFDVGQCIEHAKAVNPQIQVLSVSALSGEGMDGWYAWLRAIGPRSRTVS